MSTKKITATSRFLHGKMAFEKGLSYEVPAALADYFVQQKWAVEASPDTLAHPVPSWILSDGPSAPSADTREEQTLTVSDVHQVLGAKL